jgi:uncharacterized protein YggU (UPF0235/DUF167 family)
MYLKLRVISDANKEKVEKVSDDTWHISVKQPAVNNAANTRILEIIHEAFPGKSVRIISGHHSPSKIVSIG